MADNDLAKAQLKSSPQCTGNFQGDALLMTAHILILDDDLSSLEMLQLVLETEGDYRVTIARTLGEDLSEIERLHPNLILLDFKFGGRELGWDYLQKLRLSRATSMIPIIVCTAALRDAREQEEILLQKGIPVLYKPFDIDELLRLVKQRLDHSSREERK